MGGIKVARDIIQGSIVGIVAKYVLPLKQLLCVICAKKNHDGGDKEPCKGTYPQVGYQTSGLRQL